MLEPVINAATRNHQQVIRFFQKVKFGLRKAFFIYFEMATTTKGLSAN